VGVDSDGYLIGPWDGEEWVDQLRIPLDSEKGRRLADNLFGVIVRVFDIKTAANGIAVGP
jgi:hypothetical protein